LSKIQWPSADGWFGHSARYLTTRAHGPAQSAVETCGRGYSVPGEGKMTPFLPRHTTWTASHDIPIRGGRRKGIDDRCGAGSLPLRHRSEPFQKTFVKIQSGFGVREPIGCRRLEGGVGVAASDRGGDPQNPSVRWVRDSDIGPRWAKRIDTKEGGGRDKEHMNKTYKYPYIHMLRKSHCKGFTLGRRLCPGKHIWECLEQTAASPTQGRERTRELEEPRQQDRSRPISSRNCPGTNRRNPSRV